MKKGKHIRRLTLVCLLLAIMLPVRDATPGEAPGDIRYEREDKSEIDTFPPSIFPHWVHRINYRCDACHDSLFEMKYGATPVTMDLMKEGKVCGACHNGDLAFPVSLQSCNRCHVSVEE